MTKRICALLAILFTFCIAGCTAISAPPSSSAGDESTESQPITEETVQTVYQIPMAAVSVPTITENALADDGTVLFQYTYQNMSLILQDPDVADKIIVDFLNRVDATRETATSASDMAVQYYNGDKNWVPYVYHVTYSPTRIDQGVLSLFGTNAVYTGAFHPDRTCVSASYDLVTGDVLTLASIMSTTATTDDFCDLILNSLSEMSEGDYLYENYQEAVKHRFMVDASQDEAWYFTQTGLCFYFAPYEIAPYSSGVISVEIPYENLTDLLYDAYFPSERDTAEGMITVQPFAQANLADFSHIAELVANKDGDMYFAYTTGSVQDVRIWVSDAASSYTIFAAYNLSAGDGIMIQAESELLDRMSITYKNGQETVSYPLIQ